MASSPLQHPPRYTNSPTSNISLVSLTTFSFGLFLSSLEQDLNEQDVEEGGEAGSLPTHRTSDLPSLGLGGKFMGMLGVNGGASSGGGGSRGEDGEEDFRPFIRRLPGESMSSLTFFLVWR